MILSRNNGAVLAAAVSAGIAVGAGTALSQAQEGGGLRFTLDVGTELRARDNRGLDPVSDGVTLRNDTRLTFGLHSETRTQRLEASVGGTLRAEEDSIDGFSFGFEDPSARLSYTLEGAQVRLSFDGSFARSEVDGFAPLADGAVLTDTGLIADDGLRDDHRLAAVLELGTSAPLGFQLDLSHQGTRYRDTTDPRLFDSTTDRAAATAILRFAGQSELRGQLSYEAEDATATTRETRAGSLELRASYEFWQATASVGGREIVNSVAGTRLEGEAALALTRERQRGSVGVSLRTELTLAGQRNTLEAKSVYALPNGRLRFSLGAVDADTISPQPVGALEYTHQRPRSRYSTSFSRAITVNDTAGFQRSTSGRLGADFELSAVALIAFGLDYTDVQGAGGGAVVGDSARGSFSATYRHALAQDWSLSAGYELRYLDEAGSVAAWDNAVFVTLERSFEWARD